MKKLRTRTVSLEENGKRVTFECLLARTLRRCPHCESNKWEWLGALSTTPDELEKYLLVKYRCLKCGAAFLVEEAMGSKLVTCPDPCKFCGSRNIRRTSKDGADLELWVCRQCNGYMGVQGDDPSSP